jgi:hypothetical protein
VLCGLLSNRKTAHKLYLKKGKEISLLIFEQGLRKKHPQRGVLALLNKVIIQLTALELIHRAACLCREIFKPDPHEQRAADMIALDARLPALAAFQSAHLFALTDQRLNFPAEAPRLLCGPGGLLRQVVGHNVVRAVGRHHNPEQLNFVLFGKSLIQPC